MIYLLGHKVAFSEQRY